MNDLAKELFNTAGALARAQAELAKNIDAAPRMVYLLWTEKTLLGICGTAERAKQERQQYEDLGGKDIVIEPRVVHS